LGLWIADFIKTTNPQSTIPNPKSKLFIFPMQSVATATTAKLFEFQPSRRILFVFRRYIIALFTFSALQNYVISWHISILILNLF
jgi:hypothetical protein